jgi:hypothetical protein
MNVEQIKSLRSRHLDVTKTRSAVQSGAIASGINVAAVRSRGGNTPASYKDGSV